MPLEIDQGFANPRDRRDDGGALADLLRLQGGIAELFGIEFQGCRDCGGLIPEIVTGLHQSVGHRAIDHAGVEVTIAVMVGEPLAERTLARGRGPIDGDNHENSAPSERIIGIKSGKLVAMKAVSSTVTG